MSVHFLLKEIHKVNVLGFSIDVIANENNQPVIPIHGLVEVIGLNYGDEYQRLKNDRRFGAANLRMRANNGDTYEEVVVPLTKLHAFLFAIDGSKLNAEAAARLELFQNECVDVLNDYWNKGLAINDRLERGNTESTKYRDARKLSRPALVEAVKRLCDYGRANEVAMDEDDTYHHLICFCWDRLGRGPMKAENESVDTKVYGVDSYLLAAMERAAVRLIDHVIEEERPIEDVLQYLDEGIENELSKIGERAFEVLERL
jgi:hypothetical protein